MEQILRLTPYFSHTIWGGSRLRSEFGYAEPGDDIGECWGISAHPSGESTVTGGPYDGCRLSELWRDHRELFGNLPGDRFPLLVKLIDAKDDLSIQVHPDDAYAAKYENGSLGKTECWYVLDCPEGATLVAGHNARTREELRGMIREGRWTQLIREVPVHKGDFIQIDPGTVHAIKGGILLLETQQSSDITYRLYDYDRLQNGKPRELHLDKSIDVISVPAKPVEESVVSFADAPENRLIRLQECRYYKVSLARVNGTLTAPLNNPFTNFSVVSGTGSVNGLPVRKGDHLILTHALTHLTLEGHFEAILSNP
ncbi:MAG: class I mannose-6-phosphate isomerase [Lachnospiraceae bacterium]|nr:class I mannose-6-phosphate isomerase [Lachnospiraceae bacterium]